MTAMKSWVLMAVFAFSAACQAKDVTDLNNTYRGPRGGFIFKLDGTATGINQAGMIDKHPMEYHREDKTIIVGNFWRFTVMRDGSLDGGIAFGKMLKQ